MLIDMSPPGGINADSRVGLVYSMVRDTTDGSRYSLPLVPKLEDGGTIGFDGDSGVAPL